MVHIKVSDDKEGPESDFQKHLVDVRWMTFPHFPRDIIGLITTLG